MKTPNNATTPDNLTSKAHTLQTKGMSYQGKVKVNILNKKNKLISTTTYHNNGCYNLFTFLINCLAQKYEPIATPQRIVVFTFEDTEKFSPEALRWNTNEGRIEYRNSEGTKDVTFRALTPALTYIGGPKAESHHGEYSLGDLGEVSFNFKIPGDLIGTQRIHAMALYNGEIESKKAQSGDAAYIREALAYYYFQADPTESNLSDETVAWKPLQVTEDKDFIIQIIWTLSVQN
jgi:hypothetical protein